MLGSLVKEATLLSSDRASVLGIRRLKNSSGRYSKINLICSHGEKQRVAKTVCTIKSRQLSRISCTCSRWQRGTVYRFNSGLCRDTIDAGNPHVTHVTSALSTILVTQIPKEAEKWRLDDDIVELKDLQRQLQLCKNIKDKIAILDKRKRVRGVFGGNNIPGIYVKPPVALAIQILDDFDLYVLKCLVAIGQEQLLDWPSALLDVYAVEEESNVVLEACSSLHYIFSWLGRAIDNCTWRNAGASFLQGVPTFSTNASEGKLHLAVPREVDFIPIDPSCKDADESVLKLLKVLIAALVRVEFFYDSIGGIIGYQLRALELIRESEVEKHDTDILTNGSFLVPTSTRRHFAVPQGPDLSTEKAFALRAASWGLEVYPVERHLVGRRFFAEGLPSMGEIFPLGGAGDRLGLIDESTGECLPVAMLPYCGRTLLEGLIRDLQAREFLYFKVFGVQQITPVAIMTSAAKRNDERVRALCKSHDWFGRGEGNFRLFEQPLVPTVAAADGRWLVTEPLQAIFKPGGHGVIWKLASDEGVFKWFYSKGRTAAIIRQISNPMAATDCTLLALSGIGLKHKKKFGFASCERKVGTAEGVNVVIETGVDDGSHEYAVSCIEYTEFKKLGILDVPVTPGSMQAQYPANTNVLYVDLPSVERLASSQTAASLPGMIMNLKKHVVYDDQFGNSQSVKAGRLECTMQNVADFLTNKYTSRLSSAEQWKLDTYVIYNQRRKVTSSAKRRRKQGEHSLHQTPDGSFLDLTRNWFDLLNYCGVQMPQMEGNHCYVDFGPPFVVFLHPALGPLWDIIRQKIKGGSLAAGSELQLEIAEFSWSDVQLDGSLLVTATNIVGAMDSGEDRILQYGLRCGKCRLHNVQIKNKGIDWKWEKNVFWKNKIRRLEAAEVILEDDAEFEASCVTIEGSHKFFVPRGHRMIVANSTSGSMVARLELLPIGSKNDHGSWFWKYELDASGEVSLTAINS